MAEGIYVQSIVRAGSRSILATGLGGDLRKSPHGNHPEIQAKAAFHRERSSWPEGALNLIDRDPEHPARDRIKGVPGPAQVKRAAKVVEALARCERRGGG